MTAAQKAEATSATFEVDYLGEQYTIDPLKMTWDTLEEDAAGNYARVVSDLLGDEQWALFKERHQPMRVDDDGELVATVGELRILILTAMGNPKASSSS